LAKSCHFSSLKSRASLDCEAASRSSATNCSLLNGLRPSARISNWTDDKHPMHARSKSAGISLRRVRSPVPPKITSVHLSALGNDGVERCSTGVASTIVATDHLLYLER